MKHPMRNVRRSVQKVRKGRKVAIRKIARATKKLREDPKVRRLLAELLHWLSERLVRLLLIAALEQLLRRRGPATREPGRVIPLRPRLAT
jgi:hypothetical protein